MLDLKRSINEYDFISISVLCTHVSLHERIFVRVYCMCVQFLIPRFFFSNEKTITEAIVVMMSAVTTADKLL